MAIVCCWGLGRVAHSRPNLCGSFVGHSRAGHLKQLLGKRSQRDRRIDVAAVAGGNPAVTRRGLALLPALLLASEQLLLAGPAEAATATGTDLTSREQEVADVYDKVAPAVVNIYDITLQGRVPGNPREGPQVEGNGSGFVFDKEGHVVTNYHVLANILGGAAGKVLPGAKVAQVFLQGPDGIQRAFDGFIVGSDKARDLVVLRIDAPRDQLAPVTLGDSAALRVGQSVLAIGSPFGFGGTLTTGVVSSLGRGFQSLTGSTIGGGIQTDAAINPGNSGGPLLDLKGRVVGVNTAIFTSTGLSVGVGFAIPINTVARVVPQLIDSGRVSRASLGVQIAPDPVARALKVSEGAMIQVVNPDSPAAAAGLLGTRRGLGGIVAGDVIVSLDGRRVRSPFDLSSILDSLTPGRDVTVGVVRGVGQSGSQEVRVEVKLGTEQ